MGFIIEFDTPEQEERHLAIKAGRVFCAVDEPNGVIEVSWAGWMNKDNVIGLKLKSIGGKGVVGGGGHIPLSLTNCRSLRNLFGDDLEIGEALNDWAFREIDRLGSIENLSDATSDAQLSAAFGKQAPAIARIMHAYQRAGTAFCAATKRALLADQPGLGKAQPVSEPVLTPGGWTVMGELSAGDEVIGSDGKPTLVTGVFPQPEPREVVEVSFSDGSVVRCDWDHLWTVRTKDHRFAGLSGWTRTAKELRESGLYIEKGKRRRYDVPMPRPVEFDSVDLPLDPYLIGVLLGDGGLSSHSAYVTTDPEIVDALVLPEDVSVKLACKVSSHTNTYRLNGLAKHLRELDMMGHRSETKSIPFNYMRGSSIDRISVLQGLIDTDGTAVPSRESGRGTTIEYGTVSPQLAKDVAELVRSVGGTTSTQEKIPTYTHAGEVRNGQRFYRMVLSLPSGITPFRLRRKLGKWVPRSKYEPSKSIVSIEGTGVYENAVCISVAAADSLYITSGYTLTHNTLQTIATMVEAQVEGDIIVLAPSAAVAITWPDELRTWLPTDEVVQVIGTGPKRHQILLDAFDRERTAPRRWFIVNLEMARARWIKPSKEYRKNKRTGLMSWMPKPGWWDYSYPEFFGDYTATETINKKKVQREVTREPWAAVVVDESHRCLIAHTNHLQGQTQIRAGMAQLPLRAGGIKLALSGTPMRGKPENLWGTLNWLYPERYSSYWNWVARWFVVWGDNENDRQIEGLDEDSAADFYQDIKPMMLRRTKKEVRAELPDKLYAGTPLPDEFNQIDENSPVGHWVEMNPKQKKAYEEIRDNAETLLESGILVANGVLAELTRLKQFSTTYGDLEAVTDRHGDDTYKFKPMLPSAKFDWLVEFLSELGIDKNSSHEPDEDEEVRKVVIASQFTSILDLYDEEFQRLGIKTLKITGKVSQKQRKVAKDTWQEEGGPRVFLLNTQAGGVSLTLDAADDLVFLDETWIPDDQEQVEDRIHRVSRMHQVTIHYLRSLGTIEENIALTTGSRERVTKRLIDGERGVSFAKRLLTPIKRPS